MEYNCLKCGDEWYEDIEDRGLLSDICPLCSMPITQMWHDVYEAEGLLEVIRMTLIRIFK
jgi:DNA-directed RNA polymerase subunit RPC12/RpoP